MREREGKEEKGKSIETQISSQIFSAKREFPKACVSCVSRTGTSGIRMGSNLGKTRKRSKWRIQTRIFKSTSGQRKGKKKKKTHRGQIPRQFTSKERERERGKVRVNSSVWVQQLIHRNYCLVRWLRRLRLPCLGRRAVGGQRRHPLWSPDRSGWHEGRVQFGWDRYTAWVKPLPSGHERFARSGRQRGNSRPCALHFEGNGDRGMQLWWVSNGVWNMEVKWIITYLVWVGVPMVAGMSDRYPALRYTRSKHWYLREVSGPWRVETEKFQN